MGWLNKTVKPFFLDLISFNSPQAILFNLSFILIFLKNIPSSFLDKFPPTCIFRNWILPLIFGGNCPETGIFANCLCPACGLTRALSHLLHGNVIEAWQLNKIVFLFFLVIICLIIFNSITLIKSWSK